jgi:hypothetical protein
VNRSFLGRRAALRKEVRMNTAVTQVVLDPFLVVAAQIVAADD